MKQHLVAALFILSLPACKSASTSPLAPTPPGADSPAGGNGGNGPTTNDPGNAGNGGGGGAVVDADGGAGDVAGTDAGAAPGSDAGAINGGGAAPSPFIDTAAGIHSFLTFDDYVTVAQIPQVGPHIDFIWGANANKLAAWRAANPKAYLTFYIPFNQDPTGQSLSWWQANHPDWVVYKCDRTTPATAAGYGNIDLDITNPAVQAWQLDMVKNAAAKGYDGIAWDLYALDNAHHGCGIYRNGQWVQQYTGNFGDPQFQTAALGWLKTTYSAMHALPKPMGVVPNYTLARSADDPATAQVLANVDAILDEDFPANWGSYTTGYAWLQRIAFMDKVQLAGKGYYAISEYPSTVSTDSAQWSLASYLMGREHHAGLFVGVAKASYGKDPWRPEWATAIGAACGAMTATSGGAYVRTFAGGISLANPSATATVTYTLPATNTYHDLSGNAVAGTVTLAPHGGLVLVSALPGC